MKKLPLTAAASVLAALVVGLIAPVDATAADIYNPADPVTKAEQAYPNSGETHYGTYQNKNKRQSVNKR